MSKLSSWFQQFLNWIKSLRKKPDPTPDQTPDTEPATPVDPEPAPTGELIDPPGFPAEWVRARAESEEVGMEQDCGIVIRCRVWYPSVRNWFILSTPFKSHVRNGAGGKQVDQDFVLNGALWHLRGWMKQSPSNNSNPSPTMDETGTVSRLPVAMWECRVAAK